MIYSLLHGLVSADIASLVVRLALGSFFVLARFRYFFDPSKTNGMFLNVDRHTSLRNKMCHCGYAGNPSFFANFTAVIEVFAGLGVLFGLLTTVSAFGLLVITLCGTMCTAKTKVMEQHPVDKLDCVSCYLWRVEGLYLVFAALVFVLGPGVYSLDHIFLGV